ncbi:MAG: CAP domain-containing protein [Candidatus Brocadiia bacterium]
MPHRLARLVLALLAAGLPAARAGEEGPSPAQAFLRALKAGDARARRRAWSRLQAAGEPIPSALVEAVDEQRERAWAALERLLRHPGLKEPALALREASSAHGRAALEAVRGDGFSKSRLDQAMEPIDDALGAALEALRGLPRAQAILEAIHEMETYAADTPLRFDWSEELADALVSLELVGRAAGHASGREVLERNRRFAAWIDAAEAACVARLNVHRMLLGLHPAEIDLRLTVAAKKHSEEMVAKGYFSHTSPTAHLRSPGQRAKREHTSWAGECIARGPSGGVGAFRTWYYSQGHHKIMVGGAKTVGVGRCGTTWTLMMGNSRMQGRAAQRMASYVRRRYLAGDDPARLYELARWCVARRLLAQAEDELERLHQLDPDHEQAREALEALRARGR